MRAGIPTVVDDLPRRAELLQQVDQMESILLEQNGDLSRLSQELQVLNGDYDATQAAFESVLGQFAERSRVRFDRVQAAHFAMVERMDAKEWKQVIHLERAALEAMGTPTAPEMPGGKP